MIYPEKVKITHWGVRPDTSPLFAKRIILTNILGLMFTVNMSTSALAFAYFGHQKLAIFTFCFALSEFCWPLLNRFGHYTLSRACLLISSNVLGFLVSVVLPNTGYNRGFYVMAGLPVLLFDLKERGFILLGLILPLVLYPISEWAQFQLPPEYVMELSPVVTSTISYSIGIIYVGLIFLMFYFVAKENLRTEIRMDEAMKTAENEKRKIEELHLQLEEQRAQAFASAKLAALGEMASGITHEINNPLTSINLNTQHLRFLIQNDSKEDALAKLDLISRTVYRIARIVDSMNNVSREGSQDLMKTESLSQIVDDTLTFCYERFRQHSVKLNIHVPEQITLECRAVQISQLLLNLLNNAFDAIEGQKEKWITLEASEVGEHVVIYVTDSGKGVPEEVQKKIFQPLFTTKPSGKGTGLGLSLSNKIAQDHKGKIYLDPYHLNTRFVVELPGHTLA